MSEHTNDDVMNSMNNDGENKEMIEQQSNIDEEWKDEGDIDNKTNLEKFDMELVCNQDITKQPMNEEADDKLNNNTNFTAMKLYGVCLVCVIVLTVIILLVYVFESKGEEIISNPTIFDSLPQPGISYEYLYENQTQNMTLNENVTYFNPNTTLSCIIEFDEDGNLDSNISYIQILDDYADTVKVDTVLLAGAPMFDSMDINCSLVPAVMVTEIINHTMNGILTLYIREADMFEYIDELDVNMTNITLIDSGIDVGEIQKIKHLANYFSNITFSNITYTELETICLNVSENGTIMNEIPMIDGSCDDLSVIDYFGQEKGIDSIQFGSIPLTGIDSNYSVDPSNGRRRLWGFFKKIMKKTVKKVTKITTKVVKKVKKVATDIVNIVKGDINKRIFHSSLSIDGSRSFGISGSQDQFVKIKKKGSGLSGAVAGSFQINSGVDFYSSIHCDLVAKYKIFSKNPSFDLFRLIIGGETRFKAYFDIKLDGTVNIKYEIDRIEKRFIFWLGPIPIIIRPYAAISLGVKSKVFLDFALEFGYKPTSFEYGIEWNKKGGGWKTINKALVFKPYKNFGSAMNDDGNCLEFALEPYVEVKLGMVFSEIVDVSIIPTISLISQFQYPATCNPNIHQCDYSPSYRANFNMQFEFKVAIGLEVGLLAKEIKTNLPSIVKVYKLPFLTKSIKLFDKCFKINSLSFIGDQCCALKDPTIDPTPSPTSIPTEYPTKTTVIPTFSPTKHPSSDPTPIPTIIPSINPTYVPTSNPTSNPTNNPTVQPTSEPTSEPTVEPTSEPTLEPTLEPTSNPTSNPSTFPTNNPSSNPTVQPTSEPTSEPTVEPTVNANDDPTNNPTNEPTLEPTLDPTLNPSNNSTVNPTFAPRNNPTTFPTNNALSNPIKNPSSNQTVEPIVNPTKDGFSYNLIDDITESTSVLIGGGIVLVLCCLILCFIINKNNHDKNKNIEKKDQNTTIQSVQTSK